MTTVRRIVKWTSLSEVSATVTDTRCRHRDSGAEKTILPHSEGIVPSFCQKQKQYHFVNNRTGPAQKWF